MTNRIALILAAILVVAICVDLALGWGGTMFAMRKMLDLIDYVMFWR
ncbi:hypothetical protein QCN27_05895 [Cereibacter sp. SYSU M97828]|nr:hypothetical protein [Cereibacter flavus]